MRGILIVALLMGATFFIVENAGPVTLTLMDNTFTMSHAVLLAGILGIGIFIGMLLSYRK